VSKLTGVQMSVFVSYSAKTEHCCFTNHYIY